VTDERIKLRHLQCVLAVARLGSLQKAAEVLAISQPAVSKTVKELEALLGVRLLERGRKGAELTADGAAFARHAEVSVGALRQAVASVVPGPGRSGPVRLGALPTVAPAVIPQVLARLQAGSKLSLRVQGGTNPQLLSQLRQGELDLVIGRFAEPALMLGLSFEHLYTDPLVLVVRPGHPLHKLSEAEAMPRLLEHTLILPLPDTAIRHAADNFLSTRGLGRPEHLLETLSVSLARQHTLESDAIWFTPLGPVRAELQAGHLARLPINTEGSEEMVGLILRADHRPSPAQQQVIDALHELAVGKSRPLRHKPPGRSRKPSSP
jgi:LysR family pca operon transcriptional activator